MDRVSSLSSRGADGVSHLSYRNISSESGHQLSERGADTADIDHLRRNPTVSVPSAIQIGQVLQLRSAAMEPPAEASGTADADVGDTPAAEADPPTAGGSADDASSATAGDRAPPSPRSDLAIDDDDDGVDPIGALLVLAVVGGGIWWWFARNRAAT